VAFFLDAISQDGIFVVRLLVAMILGGLVGMERQTRGRAAGLRTNILVCLGSAAIIVAFQKLSLEFNMSAESAIRMDPARAAAGVITGIGFLGAGTIVKSKDFVRGLTTVALYALNRLPIKGDHYFSLQLKWIGDLGLIAEITDQLNHEGVQIKNRSVVRQPKTKSCQVVLILRIREKGQEAAILDQLQGDERFDEVSWN